MSLNKAVGTGESSYVNKSLIWIWSADSKYMTLENIISVLYTSAAFFVSAAFPDVFIATTSFFIVERKLSGRLLWNEVICFSPISAALFTFTFFSDV